ncbi:MAG: [protein-PII] uridylyltransferase, partial [Myxococcota bacterium]
DFFDPFDRAVGADPEVVTSSVRAYLAEVRTYLLELHDEGVSARRVNEEHTDLIDRLIRKLFRVSEDTYHARNPRLDLRMAVLASGGYGRRELALASDVDLLILYRGKLNPYVETIAEAIMYGLWDARVDVACATRTIRECLRQGKEDLPTLTSYLDARFLVGDAALAAELEHEVQAWIHQHASEFIEGKLEEQRLRHERFGESPYLLQPNIRESVGGLRDGQTVCWIARAVNWDVRSPEDLHLHGIIDAEELADLTAALEFLWRVRNELHRGGRKDDRLHYAMQESLAEYLGFKGDEKTLGIEELMRAYYLHARALQRICSRATVHVSRLDQRRKGQEPAPWRAVEEGFVLALDQLEIPHAEMLRERPVRLLSAFAVAQRYEASLSTRAQRLVRQNLGLVEQLQREPEASRVFREILTAENHVYRTLTAMNEVGVLGAYLPEFAALVGMWQHDLYHTYTVDVHSLFLVEQLRRLLKGRFGTELPLATELIRETPDLEMLYLGCMLHDIGKGQGGGHSERGAKMVPPLARRLGLSRAEENEVTFLVRHHLHMSALAENRDVNDPRLVVNFARFVGHRRRLRNLYLLTIADIRSVSPEAWNAWKGGLLEALYRNTADWLEAQQSDARGSHFLQERSLERPAEVEGEVVQRLEGRNVPIERAVTFLESLPKRYLLLHHPDQIVVHLEAALAYIDEGKRVGVHLHYPEGPEAGSCELVLFAADQPGLLSSVTGILAAAGRNILSAYVYTTREGIAVEIYRLTSIAGGVLEEQEASDRLERRIEDVIEGRTSVEDLIVRHPADRPRGARARPPVVRLSNEDSDLYSIIDVEAEDRPGLLYDITRTLSELGVNIVMSRAATRAQRITDAFYVRDSGHKILDPVRQEQILQALLGAIEAAPA